MDRYRLESSIRSVGIAYILLFFAGAHYAYLNKWGTQIVFWLTFGGFGIWWLIDVFRMNDLVYDFNEPIFDELDWIEEEEREMHEVLELKRRAYVHEMRRSEIYR